MLVAAERESSGKQIHSVAVVALTTLVRRGRWTDGNAATARSPHAYDQRVLGAECVNGPRLELRGSGLECAGIKCCDTTKRHL